MSDFSKWLLGLVKALFQPVWDFLTDFLIAGVELILQAFAAIITAIPVPSFATSGLGNLLAAIPGDVWFFAGHFRLGECFAVLGVGATFRLTRKFATLFQW